MIDLVLNWLDFLWIPLALVFLRKDQKLKGVLFILACMLSLRLQVELMTESGYQQGFLPFLTLPVLYRGYLVYGFFIFAFLLLGHVSKERDSFIYMAAAISVFIVAFCVSMAIMVL